MKHPLLVPLAAAVLFVSNAAGHGGVYIPPQPPGQPNGGTNPGPGDVPTPPPPSTPGPTTPGPSGPGPATPGPATPSGPSSPGGGTARPASPSGGGAVAPGAPAGSGPASLTTGGPTLESWRAWWHYNSDLYLDIKGAVYRSAPTTGGAEPFLGFGQEETAATGREPTDAQLAELVLPSLLRVWDDERADVVRSACAEAVAQIGPYGTREQSVETARLLQHELGSGNRDTVEISTAAYGLLGRRRFVPLLCDLLLDSEAGREACGEVAVPERTSAMAAYALAVALERDHVVDMRSFVQGKVLEALANGNGRTPDLGVACVTTLGILGELARESGGLEALESSSEIGLREGRTRALSALLVDERANRVVRAHVPRALARQVSAGEDSPLRARVIGLLVDGLDARHREIRYGCIQALGLLGDCDADPSDVALRKALLRRAREGDLYDRNFARIALGEVAGRAGANGGAGSGQGGSRSEILALLLRDLGGRKNQLRPWAALGLGVMAHGLRAEGAPVPEAVTSALRLSLQGARTPEEVGAFALALGLARDNASAATLLAKFEGSSDDDARSWLALALGMVDAREALPVLEEELAESLRRPALMQNASVALALLGDEDVGDALIRTLLDEPTTGVAAGVARALGFVGDASSIAPLLEVLDRRDLGDWTRSFVVVALGLVGDRQRVPWTRPLAEHVNYLALTDTLHSYQGSGVLNIR